jgi:hypothetical protein
MSEMATFFGGSPARAFGDGIFSFQTGFHLAQAQVFLLPQRFHL